MSEKIMYDTLIALIPISARIKLNYTMNKENITP